LLFSPSFGRSKIQEYLDYRGYCCH
jgi:hypothetical protein